MLPFFINPSLHGAQIRCQRPGSSVYHHGILVQKAPCGWTVIHNEKGRGVIWSSYEEFLAGAINPEVVTSPPTLQHGQLWADRAFIRIGTHYDLIYNNCEHFCTWVTSGRPRSQQLAGATFFATLGGIAVWAIKASGQ